MGTMIVSLNDRETRSEIKEQFGQLQSWKDWWTPQWIARDLCKQHGITLKKVSIGYTEENVDPISAKLICPSIIATVEMDVDALNRLAEDKYRELHGSLSNGRYHTSIVAKVNRAISAMRMFTLVKTGKGADRSKDQSIIADQVTFAEEYEANDVVEFDECKWLLLKEIEESGKDAFIASKLEGQSVVDYAVFRKLPNNRWPFKLAA